MVVLPAFASPTPLVRCSGTTSQALCKRRRLHSANRPRCALSAGNGTRDELALLSLLAGGVGQGLSAEARDRIDLAAGILEAQTAPLQYPRDLALLDGAWTLLYTTNAAGVPSASAGASGPVTVRQYYDTTARRVENCISFTGGLPVPATVVIAATFDVSAVDTLMLALVDIQFKLGADPTRARDLTPRIPLPRNDGAVAKVLETIRNVLGREPPPVISPDVRTTYLGIKLRITRSSGGEMRVFCRPE